MNRYLKIEIWFESVEISICETKLLIPAFGRIGTLHGKKV